MTLYDCNVQSLRILTIDKNFQYNEYQKYNNKL